MAKSIKHRAPRRLPEGPIEVRDIQSPQEEEEENFVTGALFTAIEEGNYDGVKELLDTAEKYDINQKNRHGESPVHLAASTGQTDILKYLESKKADLEALDKHGDTAVSWAARQGHTEVIEYLKEHGVPLNTQNKAGEAAIHVAARYGHTAVIEYLCTAGINLNLQDKLGETVLHGVAWHGLSGAICRQLCEAGCKFNSANMEGETPLHCAAARGNVECVRSLLQSGALINLVDRRGFTPLHLACRRCHSGIALLLLHAGCQFDILDQLNETALHSAAREGLLPVTQTLCAFGCRLDIVSKAGVTPLHLAARGGHTEIVRCLLLSGAEPDLPNKDGVTAEIMALAQGHNDVAELLIKLKPERRDVYMRQLMPTNRPLDRVKVKLFGNSGSGKTVLVDSLKCGYFGSFFRKARLSSTSSLTQNQRKSLENGSTITRHHSLPSQLSYDITNEAYTKGIDVQQASITSAGELSLWDFSGYEPYYMLYDHFMGDPNCIHMVLFSLEEPQRTQLAQVTFWLNFIKARIPPYEPIGPNGRPLWPAKVILVATHADKVGCLKNARGEFVCPETDTLAATVREKFHFEFDISDPVFVVDAHLAMSPELKTLRAHIGDLKDALLKTFPTANGFLDATVATLPAWRKTTASFPVLPWSNFMEFIRTRVNTLASEEHMKALVQHLQLMGDVVYIRTLGSEEDLVVLCPHWLCSEVIGELLCQERLLHTRPTGCLTAYDFTLMYPETEATELLGVLEALNICTRCEVEEEIEYEVPALNFVETLHGLWEKDLTRFENAVYGGVRIQCPRNVTNQVMHVFPRMQVELRRNLIADSTSEDTDLYQWHHGSKYCCGLLECLISLEQSDQVIEVKCRGPQDARTSLFYFFEDMCEVVESALDDICPGITFERHILSPLQLSEHVQTVHSYAPHTVLQAQMEGKTTLTLDESTEEDFYDLVCFGSEEIKSCMTLGINLHVSYLDVHSRQTLCRLLDPSHPMGRDWCLLAVSLGLTDNVPHLDDSKRRSESRTDRTLEEWSHSPNATISLLINKLQELGRQDAIDALLNTGPLMKVFHGEASPEEPITPTGAHCHSSNNTLSSVSR